MKSSATPEGKKVERSLYEMALEGPLRLLLTSTCFVAGGDAAGGAGTFPVEARSGSRGMPLEAAFAASDGSGGEPFFAKVNPLGGAAGGGWKLGTVSAPKVKEKLADDEGAEAAWKNDGVG